MSYQLLNQIRLYFKWRIFNFKKMVSTTLTREKNLNFEGAYKDILVCVPSIHPYKTNISDKKLI